MALLQYVRDEIIEAILEHKGNTESLLLPCGLLLDVDSDYDDSVPPHLSDCDPSCDIRYIALSVVGESEPFYEMTTAELIEIQINAFPWKQLSPQK